MGETGVTDNKYLFAGEQFDEGLGDYYLRQRYYDTNIGRFTRRDTYEGLLEDPLSLHKYTYTHANPVTYIDPTGLFTIADVSAAESIRNELVNQQISTGQDILDRIFSENGGSSLQKGFDALLSLHQNATGIIALVGIISALPIGRNSKMRRATRSVSYGGQGLPVVTGQWLRGDARQAARIPKQVADKLANKKFNNFDEFRSEFWKSVEDTPELSQQFDQSSRTLMRQGNAPFADAVQQLPGNRTQQVYSLHHIQPISQGGGLYDLDNIIVVSPMYHRDLHP